MGFKGVYISRTCFPDGQSQGLNIFKCTYHSVEELTYAESTRFQKAVNSFVSLTPKPFVWTHGRVCVKFCRYFFFFLKNDAVARNFQEKKMDIWTFLLLAGMLHYFTRHCLISASVRKHLSLCVRKPTICVPTRSNTNRAVQSQKMARGWKFWI